MSLLKNQKGVTMIEVVIASLLIVLMISAFFYVFMASSRTDRQGDVRSQATQLLANVMDVMRLKMAKDGNFYGSEYDDGTQDMSSYVTADEVNLTDKPLGYNTDLSNSKVDIKQYISPGTREHRDGFKKVTVRISYEDASEK